MIAEWDDAGRLLNETHYIYVEDVVSIRGPRLNQAKLLQIGRVLRNTAPIILVLSALSRVRNAASVVANG